MREIKIEVMFELHNKDFTTSIGKHYTSVDRLTDGKDCFDYASSKIIAKRQFTGIKDSDGKELYVDDVVEISGTGACIVSICPYNGVIFTSIIDKSLSTDAYDCMTENEDVNLIMSIYEMDREWK